MGLRRGTDRQTSLFPPSLPPSLHRATRSWSRSCQSLPAAVEQGVPTLSELQVRFPTVQSAAREAAFVPEASQGMAGHMFASALAAVTIKPRGLVEGAGGRRGSGARGLPRGARRPAQGSARARRAHGQSVPASRYVSLSAKVLCLFFEFCFYLASPDVPPSLSQLHRVCPSRSWGLAGRRQGPPPGGAGSAGHERALCPAQHQFRLRGGEGQRRIAVRFSSARQDGPSDSSGSCVAVMLVGQLPDAVFVGETKRRGRGL